MPCRPEKAGRSDPSRHRQSRVSPLSGFQASRGGWAQGTHTTHRVCSCLELSFHHLRRPSSPLDLSPGSARPHPLPDSLPRDPCHYPLTPGRDQTLDGKELSLKNGPSRGFTGLHSCLLSSGARRGCLSPLSQRWEPAGAAPAPPHTAHSQLFLETIILLSQRNFITYLQVLPPPYKKQ